MVPAISALSRLEAESVRLFDQPPVTLIDLYQRRLRAQPALIRQVASQTNDDARSMDTQTEEVPRNAWIVALVLITLPPSPPFIARFFVGGCIRSMIFVPNVRGLFDAAPISSGPSQKATLTIEYFVFLIEMTASAPCAS